jgi:hypothetical protein
VGKFGRAGSKEKVIDRMLPLLPLLSRHAAAACNHFTAELRSNQISISESSGNCGCVEAQFCVFLSCKGANHLGGAISLSLCGQANISDCSLKLPVFLSVFRPHPRAWKRAAAGLRSI